MSERSVLVSQVAVYHYNAGSQRWDPLWPAEAASATGSSTPSPCRLFLTVGPEADESRILAFTTLPGEGTPPDAASTTSEGGFALLNTRLYANAQLECRAHFVQWRASSSLVIGLSFATTDQASSFVNGFRQVIAQLGASLASTQKVPSLGTLPATQSNDGERKMSRRKSFRQQTGSKLGLFTRHKDSSDSLLAPVSSAVASTSSGPISSNPSSTSATSAPGDDSLTRGGSALFSTKSSSNLSTVIAEGERALVIQVGSADLLKKAGMSGRTVRISINKETTTTKARRLVVDLLTQDAPEDVRESTTSMLAPCHLILTIGGVEKSLSKGEDLFSLALSMPSLRFDIPGLFTQISPPKFTCVRDQKAYEVYQSELAYVKTLDKIVNTLMKSSQTVLSMADSAQLFCNSDQLLVLHTRILNAVRHRLVDEWSQEALIGDIFLDDKEEEEEDEEASAKLQHNFRTSAGEKPPADTKKNSLRGPYGKGCRSKLPGDVQTRQLYTELPGQLRSDRRSGEVSVDPLWLRDNFEGHVLLAIRAATITSLERPIPKYFKAEHLEEVVAVHPSTAGMHLGVQLFDHAPLVFKELRSRAHIDVNDYLNSWAPPIVRKEQRISKSKRRLCRSFDQKYLVKQLSQGEFMLMKKMLPDYLEHIVQNPSTLLCRVTGLFNLTSGKKSVFIMVQRCGFSGSDVREIYDVSGKDGTSELVKPKAVEIKDPKVHSSQASICGAFESELPPVQRDLELQKKILLGSSSAVCLMKQLRSDLG
eukprot:CAMPEP_0177678350 /NCGR_PEP_ID=MMETSP0447-20121125/28963_1 /TAXON_ID=0 /ORGANISM="Stygamoeba regulata, Strain BSH-02190019" /LENGTH=762 /DNA_ID=CAMNT_0019187349 /DNA_START=97 /DNA_END=2382 /DNA_ORIENTATION=+